MMDKSPSPFPKPQNSKIHPVILVPFQQFRVQSSKTLPKCQFYNFKYPIGKFCIF